MKIPLALNLRRILPSLPARFESKCGDTVRNPQLLLRQFPLFLQPLFIGIPTFFWLPFEKLMADAFSRRFSFIMKTVTAFDLGRCIQGKKFDAYLT